MASQLPSHALPLGQSRERYFFRTREEALTEAAKLRDRRKVFGDNSAAISPSLAEQATAAALLLSPFGITLLEAAQRIADAESAKIASVKVTKALEAFAKAKENKSDKQVQAITHLPKHLRDEFGERVLNTIKAEELERHLETRTGGPAAYNAKIRLTVAFLRWCAKPPRGWCDGSLLAHAERKETVSSEVGVLTSSEVRRLLQAAETYFPETVVPFAIAVFTGMRSAEIQRLVPADISQEGITVPAGSAKTKRRRFIQMPEPLAAWLAAYPIGDSVCPANWMRKEKAVRRLAGWKVWSDLAPTLDLNPPVDEEPPDDSPEWPQNALRHTAASVSLALGKPLETLIFEHGHAGGTEMLRKHNIGRMPKKEALAIWSTGPGGGDLEKPENGVSNRNMTTGTRTETTRFTPPMRFTGGIDDVTKWYGRPLFPVGPTPGFWRVACRSDSEDDTPIVPGELDRCRQGLTLIDGMGRRRAVAGHSMATDPRSVANQRPPPHLRQGSDGNRHALGETVCAPPAKIEGRNPPGTRRAEKSGPTLCRFSISIPPLSEELLAGTPEASQNLRETT